MIEASSTRVAQRPVNSGKHHPRAVAQVLPGVSLSDLETFMAVAELGSFSKAAQRLNLSQPAVTGRVQKLEAVLGATLLHRTTRSVTVTPVGQQLSDRATAVLQDLRVLITDLATEKAQARKRITIATTPMLAATMLPRTIRVFVERNADVQIRLSDLRYAEAVDSVLHGDVDLGFIAMESPHPMLRFECLVEEDLVLVVPSIHPLAAESSITLRRLASHPVMLLGQYSSLQQKVAAEFERHGLQFTPAVTAGNLLTLLGMVDAGNGIALLPRSVVQLNAATPRACVEIADGDLRRRYGIVLRKSARLSVVARSFCDFLRTELGGRS